MEEKQDMLTRLAVIESRLQDIVGYLVEIRSYIPARVVEHSERIAGMERTQRSIVWGVALVASGLLSAFLAHIFAT